MEERVLKDKLCDPMIEEVFSTAREDELYQKVLTEVK